MASSQNSKSDPLVQLPELARLRQVMDTLRSPGGCAWDAEQDHASLLKYLLEESYEFIDAVERGDRIDMKEELGDLLLQVFFHARLAEESESEAFDIEDVAAGTANKLISRHPHVFGEDADSSATSGEVKANWEAIKAAEKSRTSALDGIAMGQPALALANKVIYRAEKFGHQVQPSDLPTDLDNPGGQALLALVAQLHQQAIDPEAALRTATLRYIAHIKAIEAK
jgi:XTP/dITP diphosphohydrolase